MYVHLVPRIIFLLLLNIFTSFALLFEGFYPLITKLRKKTPMVASELNVGCSFWRRHHKNKMSSLAKNHFLPLILAFYSSQFLTLSFYLFLFYLSKQNLDNIIQFLFYFYKSTPFIFFQANICKGM